MVVDTTTPPAAAATPKGAGSAGVLEGGGAVARGMRVDYYEEASDAGGDSFEAIYSCVQSNGISNCKNLSKHWLI